MTNEEFNRKMEFIVEQQAVFAADIQILKEREERLQQRQERFQLQLEAASARQDRFESQLEALARVANTALDTSTKTSEVVATLAGAQAETERQVTRVARLLEAHIREGHPNDRAQA